MPFTWTLWHNLAWPELVQVAIHVFSQWQVADRANFASMSELQVVVERLTFPHNSEVQALRLTIDNDRHIIGFRSAMKAKVLGVS